MFPWNFSRGACETRHKKGTNESPDWMDFITNVCARARALMFPLVACVFYQPHMETGRQLSDSSQVVAFYLLKIKKKEGRGKKTANLM